MEFDEDLLLSTGQVNLGFIYFWIVTVTGHGLHSTIGVELCGRYIVHSGIANRPISFILYHHRQVDFTYHRQSCLRVPSPKSLLLPPMHGLLSTIATSIRSHFIFATSALLASTSPATSKGPSD